MTAQELTAAEAAARLGIKRATLYAYVSRGLVARHMAMDGRTSLFDAAEIDAFRSDRRRTSDGELDTVLSTALTRVADGELSIRGREVVPAAESGQTYEEIVSWLWAAAAGIWEPDRDLLAAVRRVQAALPDAASLIDRLRATVVTASACDPMRFDSSSTGIHAAGRQLIAAMVHGLPERGRGATSGRLADVLWTRLTVRRGLVPRRDALNVALVLLVDHGLAASTFGARVAASVRTDPYSAVIAGLGVVGGPLHGAASAEVWRLLDDAHSRGETASAIGDVQRHARSVPGFGHAVYRTQDPRYSALMGAVSDAWRDDPRLATVHEVRDVVARRTDAIPNVDLALGALTWLGDMPPESGEGIFAISRTAGWIAHVVEEFGEKPLRFRPRARYRGVRSDPPPLG